MLTRAWRWLVRPSRTMAAGIVLLLGALIGVVLLGGLQAAIHLSNTQVFCTSCHEMGRMVDATFRASPHAANPSGVTATCADCHVPASWPAVVVHKAGSLRELYHWIVGTIRAPEAFEARRADLAERVWRGLLASDSGTCRACHEFGAMVLARQRPAAQAAHADVIAGGVTCIACHRGIAHALPSAPAVVTLTAPAKPRHETVTDAARCIACHTESGEVRAALTGGQTPAKHPVPIPRGMSCLACHREIAR